MDRFTNILQRFFLRGSLRPATRQGGTTHSIAFLGLDKNDRITKAHGPSLKVKRANVKERRLYHLSKYAKISGATIDASDSMMYFGVSAPSFPHVIFSFGTAPE